MTDEIEQAIADRVELEEVEGKIRLTFKHPEDWVIFLRKIAIHKHLREEDDANLLDDVMDCDFTFLAVAQANERLAQQSSKPKKAFATQFEETSALETDSPTFEYIFQKLKRKLENGPCFNPIDSPELRKFYSTQSEQDREAHDKYIKEFDGTSQNRRLLKSYFSPFLLTDQQADDIAKKLNMRTDGLYGRLR